MKNNGLFSTAVTALISLGIVGVAAAQPEDSQRLRGLDDRVFEVIVTLTADTYGVFGGLPIGTTFPNCYIFSADFEGNYNWFETAFPTVGVWDQDSRGAKTSYAVENIPTGFSQFGEITPSRGKGVLQLVANSFVEFDATSEGAELAFLSVGAEILGDKIDECPETPVITLPEPD